MPEKIPFALGRQRIPQLRFIGITTDPIVPSLAT